MAVTYQQALQRMELMDRMIINPNSFTDEELKDKPEDRLFTRTLKKNTRDMRRTKNDIDTTLKKYGVDSLEQLTTGIEKLTEEKNNLELKNEKLTDSYRKLINYFANARQLISHLQKDLSATQQDKAHIQKELNNALTILNKPTTEIGTKTDLTGEQISQMEKDLETKRIELINLHQEKEWDILEGDAKYQATKEELESLQTKYDLEVKTKRELAEELRLAQKYFDWTLFLFRSKDIIRKRKNFQEEEVKRILKRFIPIHVFIRMEENKDLDLSFLNEDGKIKRFYTLLYPITYFHSPRPLKLKLITSREEEIDFSQITSQLEFFKNRFLQTFSRGMRLEMNLIGEKIIMKSAGNYIRESECEIKLIKEREDNKSDKVNEELTGNW